MKTNYQFKITLVESKPPIWRRVLVPSTMTLNQLHDVIQACFGWEQCHLFAFELFGEHIDDEDPASLSKKIASLGIGEKSTFKYIYDFGDNWEHTILLEKILPVEGTTNFPHCLTGKRAGPLEDSGGMWGYEDKLAVLADKNHPEHEEISEWMGGDFDPELLDLAEVNRRLAEV